MNPDPTSAGQTDLFSRPFVCAALLLVLASLLRFYQLDGQLWLDEISALRGYRTPFLETLTTFPAFFPNPLYELMAHFSLLLLGESALSIRLPAALFGVAGVLAFYLVARRCLDSRESFLAGSLFAVSYHHIFFSQDARGYTAYLFFALLSTDRLLELLGNMRWRTAFGYVALSALGTYAHPFGLFVFAGQMVVAFGVSWLRRPSGNDDGPSPGQIVVIAALASFAILCLYAPLILSAVEYAFTEATTAGHGPRVWALLPELLAGLRAGFGGWLGILTGCLLGGLGTLDLLRRQPVTLALFGMPLLLSGVTVAALGAGIHPRYFLLALPLGYLAGTRGLAIAFRWFLRMVLRSSPKYITWAEIVCGLVILGLACIPLGRYYTVPKQDYLGALREVRELARDQDRVLAAGQAGFGITRYYDPDFPFVMDLEGLLKVEAEGRRVWVVTTLERGLASSRPELLRHLHREYDRVLVLPGTVGDGAMRIYLREPDS